MAFLDDSFEGRRTRYWTHNSQATIDTRTGTSADAALVVSSLVARSSVQQGQTEALGHAECSSGRFCSLFGQFVSRSRGTQHNWLCVRKCQLVVRSVRVLPSDTHPRDLTERKTPAWRTDARCGPAHDSGMPRRKCQSSVALLSRPPCRHTLGHMARLFILSKPKFFC